MAAAVPFIPLIASGVGAAGSIYAASKASGAAKDASEATQPYYNMLAKLASQQSQRVSQSEPLYQALVQMAYNRLPTYARSGITAPSFGSNSTNYLSAGGARNNARADYTGDKATSRY